MTERTLSQFVSQVAGAARVFSAFGLDFSCKGERYVTEACQHDNVDLDAVLAALESIEPRVGDDRLLGWDTASVEGLITHIVEQYHGPLLIQLRRAKALVNGSLETNAHDYPRLDSVLAILNDLDQDMVMHMRQEEEYLFPDLLAGRGYAASMSVRINWLQHRDTINTLEALQGLTEGYRVKEGQSSAVCALLKELSDLDIRLREHIHLENNILFPAALRA